MSFLAQYFCVFVFRSRVESLIRTTFFQAVSELVAASAAWVCHQCAPVPSVGRSREW